MRPGSPGSGAGWAAAAVGGTFAAVSLFWALGGTALLGTVGGALEAQGRAGDAGIVTLVWVTVLLKAVASVLPAIAIVSPAGFRRRWLRRGAWAAGIVLTGYGAVLTAGGLLVLGGVIPASADADLRAIRWHALFWDPWFLIWGLFVLAAMVRSRRAGSAGDLAS